MQNETLSVAARCASTIQIVRPLPLRDNFSELATGPPAPMGYLFLVQTKMKVAVYVCIGLSVLVCVCWPIAVFLSIFAFDAPSRGAADMPGRYIGVLVFLAYPWGIVAGLIHFAVQKNKAEWKPWLTCVLLLAPYLHLGLFFAAMNVIWK